MARIPVVVWLAALLNREKRDVAVEVASDRAVAPRANCFAVLADGAGKLRARCTEKDLLRRCP